MPKQARITNQCAHHLGVRHRSAQADGRHRLTPLVGRPVHAQEGTGQHCTPSRTTRVHMQPWGMRGHLYTCPRTRAGTASRAFPGERARPAPRVFPEACRQPRARAQGCGAHTLSGGRATSIPCAPDPLWHALHHSTKILERSVVTSHPSYRGIGYSNYGENMGRETGIVMLSWLPLQMKRRRGESGRVQYRKEFSGVPTVSP